LRLATSISFKFATSSRYCTSCNNFAFVLRILNVFELAPVSL
jgi:hypothetical protein